MNFKKIVYWLSTAVMCLIFLFSASMYFTKYEMVSGFFNHLGFPVWIIYPLAVAKVLAVIAILSNKSKLLKEWAYAGFFFDAVLAVGAHYMVGDSVGLSAIVIVAILVSRFLDDQRGA